MSKRRRTSPSRSLDSGGTGRSSGSESSRAHNCPLDKDALGRNTWGFLHTVAAYYPDKPSREEKADMKTFFELIGKVYPCHSCASHFRQQVAEHPVDATSQESLSQWLCHMHNLVNERTGKPIFDPRLVNERWRDGWKDGSCD